MRIKCREFLINSSIRWKGLQCGKYFDLWRDFAMKDSAVVNVQKMIRLENLFKIYIYEFKKYALQYYDI